MDYLMHPSHVPVTFFFFYFIYLLFWTIASNLPKIGEHFSHLSETFPNLKNFSDQGNVKISFVDSPRVDRSSLLMWTPSDVMHSPSWLVVLSQYTYHWDDSLIKRPRLLLMSYAVACLSMGYDGVTLMSRHPSLILAPWSPIIDVQLTLGKF